MLTRLLGTGVRNCSQQCAISGSIGSYLAFLDLVPALDVVLDDIQNSRASKRHVDLSKPNQSTEPHVTFRKQKGTDIMPGHTRTLKHRERITRIIVNILEVHNPCIIVVLPREQRQVKIGRMNISQRMVMRIPSAEAEVKTTDGRPVVVDNDHLLVMRPETDTVCSYTCRKKIGA